MGSYHLQRDDPQDSWPGLRHMSSISCLPCTCGTHGLASRFFLPPAPRQPHQQQLSWLRKSPWILKEASVGSSRAPQLWEMIVGQFLEACASLPLFPGFSSRQHTIVPSGMEPMGEALLLSSGPLCCSTQTAWSGFPPQ